MVYTLLKQYLEFELCEQLGRIVDKLLSRELESILNRDVSHINYLFLAINTVLALKIAR